MQIDDSQLQALRSGDEKIFTAIFNGYYLSLILHAQNMLKEKQEAGECVSDAFIALWNYRETIKSSTHLRNFLYQAVEWRCANANKSFMVRASHNKKYQLETLSQNLIIHQQHHGLWRPEIRRRLIKRLEQLPFNEKKVLELYLLEGRTEKEIAQILNKSTNNVQATKIQALKRLQWDWIMILVFATCLCLRLFRWTITISIIGRELFRA
ncbi:sigma-70 family RNA polymerase sigma factor [Paraflavitalea soli]|uniref:Sigma-70 family RNA polymerase sigma factor n=1 Tax=Paraflavitalea soli TaxID=2315862 RepID=A0A3B7MPM5_9BACT|nr:sigma-70 family RNA polymerase sigma factor [Paraflavitalea soli]AXY73515.1 sigma-70 family RNA polymerase sigma factor [Paraflavitalea soli]